MFAKQKYNNFVFLLLFIFVLNRQNMKATVKERLIEFLKYKGIGQKKFAQSIGLSDGYVNAIRVSIQPDKIVRIAMQYPELNTGWLLTGEGSMLKSALVKASAVGKEVLLLPISAFGGTLTGFPDSTKEWECEKIISPIKGADFAISITGESMQPEYPSGCQILIKRINEKAFIEWGKTYVLDTCNGIVVKRLFPSDSGNGDRVRCESVNPQYPPFEVALSDVYAVYRVLMCMAAK